MSMAYRKFRSGGGVGGLPRLPLYVGRKRKGGRRLGKYVDFKVSGNTLNMPMSNSPMPMTFGRGNRTSYSANRRLMNVVTGDGDPMMPDYSPIAARVAGSAPQSTRQYGVASLTETIPQRKLIATPLRFPPQGTNVGYRLGSTIKVSGFRVCEVIQNPSEFPILLHYAIIQPKDRGLELADDIRGNFFRNQNIQTGTPEQTQRSKAFVDATNNNEPWDFDYSCNGINPDKFNIIMHDKVMLAAGDISRDGASEVQVNNFAAKNNHYRLDRYFDMKGTRMTFQNSSDDQPEHPIIRVVWFQVLSGKDWSTTENQSLVIHRDHRGTVFFKNGLN